MGKARRDMTRTRLLNKLGYFQERNAGCTLPQDGLRCISNAASMSESCREPRSLLGDVIPFETKLKGDVGDCDAQSSSRSSPVPLPTPTNSPSSPMSSPSHSERSSSTTSSTTSSGTPRIHFNETVSVIPIPSHNQYSNRIKQHLWSNAREIQEMAIRNMAEFEAEGYDWRKVVLDDQMYVDSNNGTLVHPCHFQEQEEEDNDGFLPLTRSSSIF